MRRIAHGTTHFNSTTKLRILELMKLQSSASRSAYQAIHLHGLKNNEVKIYVKKDYMDDLNQGYISDAVSRTKGLINKDSLFGGKNNWKNMLSGKLSKDEWNQIRNNQLYSRGDKAKSGNRNIRIVGNKILVNDPSERSKWVSGTLFLPKRFRTKIIPQLDCYDIRLIYKDGNFQVKIGWDIPLETIPEIETIHGSIGIDTNPDGLALTEVDGYGNLIKQFYLKEQRIQFAKKNKREMDIFLLAKKVVEYAVQQKKPIVLEKLSFKKNKKTQYYKKFNRMKSNFTHRKMTDAIKSRAIRMGIQIVEVNPAFTSIVGNLKYKKMYSLNVHNSAALVIARRGIGIVERMDFNVSSEFKEVNSKNKKKIVNYRKKSNRGFRKKKGNIVLTDKKTKIKKEVFNLEGRGVSIVLSKKAWSWMSNESMRFIRGLKKATLTASELVPEETGINSSSWREPGSESLSITGQVACSLFDNKELDSMKGRIAK